MIRELGEVLAASGLGMVARHDHPHVADILLRIQNLYTGNYRFLDLLKAVNLAEMQGRRDRPRGPEDPPVLAALMAEQDEPPAVTGAERPGDRARLPRLPMPDSFRARVRRKLAPGVVGKSWRLSKRVVARVRRKLAPGVVGKSWRLSKRVLRKGKALIR